MRLIQAEIRTNRLDEDNKPVEVSKTYWLPDDPYNGRGLKVGSMVTLAEEGCFTHWIIQSLMCTMPDGKKDRAFLTTVMKGKIGTILELVSA